MFGTTVRNLEIQIVAIRSYNSYKSYEGKVLFTCIASRGQDIST